MSLEKLNTRNLSLLDSWMENFFGKSDSLLRSTDLGLTVPAVNVVEAEGSYEIELAAPGKNKEDFKIEVQNGAISISSEEETSNQSENRSFARREYSYESFQRSFTLPENVDDSKIEASYTDGVLKVVVPKVAIAAPETRRVAIS